MTVYVHARGCNCLGSSKHLTCCLPCAWHSMWGNRQPKTLNIKRKTLHLAGGFGESFGRERKRSTAAGGTLASCTPIEKAGHHGISQRVHVGIWYILRAQRGSHIPTLRPKYIPYSYMDPLGILSFFVHCTWFLRLLQALPPKLKGVGLM